MNFVLHHRKINIYSRVSEQLLEILRAGTYRSSNLEAVDEVGDRVKGNKCLWQLAI